jgi:hypothetical protein
MSSKNMDSPMASRDKLIIFDYSGTLSLEAPRFARSKNLVRALEETGLAALGVATPEVFWETIVGPTWVEGSTTQSGYRKIMADRLADLQPAASVPRARVEAAAGRFVEAYLGQSRIDPLWRPVLARLAKETASLQVVATDHYAEATGAIIGHLKALGIDATPIAGQRTPCETPANREAGERRESGFFVANSADFGVWKADRCFWERLKAELDLQGLRKVLVLDDFGLNEEAGDLYGLMPEVTARQAKTLAVLGEVFGIPAEGFPFFLAKETGEADRDAARLIAQASDRIGRFLEAP